MENRIEATLKKILEIENEAALIEKEIKKLENENEYELERLIKQKRHDIFNEAQMEAQAIRKKMIKDAHKKAKEYIKKMENHCQKLDEIYDLKGELFTKEICKKILNCEIETE